MEVEAGVEAGEGEGEEEALNILLEYSYLSHALLALVLLPFYFYAHPSLAHPVDLE